VRAYVYARAHARTRTHTHTHTQGPILNNALRFLENYDRYGKMFQKLYGSEEAEGTIDLTLSGVVKVRSRSYRFFKMEHHIFDSRI